MTVARFTRHAITAAVVMFGVACHTPAPQPPQEVVVWKQLGSWSGRGNSQTESFLGLTGALRFHWRTTNDTPPGSGTFRLILQSAISGRELHDAVDHRGRGEGTVYVGEDPRTFYVSVESADLDWQFTVEEATFGTLSTAPRPNSANRARGAATR